VHGAEPLFFLDYYACGKLDIDTATIIIKGIADGCLLANCSLVGGETAEMPGMYPSGEYDLAGFCVGAVEKEKIIDGSSVQAGDIILGIASSGAHSNGYSLIRKVITTNHIDLHSNFDGRTLANVLMAPTKIYVRSILKLIESIEIRAMAHITGGGITENIPRILPKGLSAVIDKKSWKLPLLFEWLKDEAGLNDIELYKTFNCGIGMAVMVAKDDVEKATEILKASGEEVFVIGEVKKISNNDVPVQYI
jgi:phosphoribosylformylglycinamidine cyclo-ligase